MTTSISSEALKHKSTKNNQENELDQYMSVKYHTKNQPSIMIVE